MSDTQSTYSNAAQRLGSWIYQALLSAAGTDTSDKEDEFTKTTPENVNDKAATQQQQPTKTLAKNFPFASSYDKSPRDYRLDDHFSPTIRPILKFPIRPGPVPCFSVPNPLRGHFEKGHESYAVNHYLRPHEWDIYRYRATSTHFPILHHGDFTTTKSAPWLAVVSIEFNNMDVFRHTDIDWIHNLKYRSADDIQINYDAHPYVNRVHMYEREIQLEFRASQRNDDGGEYKKGREGEVERDFLNSWKVSIAVCSQRQKDLHFKLSGLEDIISKETCVCMEAVRITDTKDPLSGEERFYIKYPNTSAASKEFVESLDTELVLHRWAFRKIMEKNFERQLYCLGGGAEEEEPAVEAKNQDGAKDKKKRKTKKRSKKGKGKAKATPDGSDNGEANQPDEPLIEL